MLDESLNVKRPRLNHAQMYWLLMFIVLVALAGFSLVTYYRPSFAAFDLQVNFWAKTIQFSSMTTVAIVVSYLFGTELLIALSLVASTFLFIKNYRAESLLLLCTTGGDALLVGITKNLIQAPRPTDMLIVDAGYSYPSGHSAGVVVFCGLLLFFALRYFHSKKAQVSLSVGFSALIVLVGFDRIYLNIHWFSDVLGGFLLGAFWLSFAIFAFYSLRDAGKFQSKSFRPISTLLFVLSFVVAVAIIVYSLAFANLF